MRNIAVLGMLPKMITQIFVFIVEDLHTKLKITAVRGYKDGVSL